jgi:hypothetical protein
MVTPNKSFKPMPLRGTALTQSLDRSRQENAWAGLSFGSPH